MENLVLINYHQTRDFGRKMSVTFEFLRQNFKPLGKSILMIAGPPVLLASLLMGSFFQDVFSNTFSTMGMGGGGSDQMLALFSAPGFLLKILLMLVFILVSSVASLATINNYILLYEEKQTNKIEVSEVWERVRDTFMMYLGTCFLFTILAIAVYVGLFIPVALLGAVSPFLIFFGVIGLIVAVFYLLISSSLIFIVRSYERTGFMEALTRSFRLVQGKWWSTFGLSMVLYLIAGTISYVFMIPWYILTVISSLHNAGVEGFESTGSGYGMISMVLLTLYYLAQMILYSLPAVGLAFQYFNLVERKEARGLMTEISTIGQPPVASAAPPDEHY
jgi:hypothetical protein